jgi:hypothetical protein
MKKQNIIFSGDRHCKKSEVIESILASLDPSAHRIIQGGCSGVDTIVKEHAQKLGFEVVTAFANWKNTTSPTYSKELGYDPNAGPARNLNMITDYPPSMVYLVHPSINTSRGTKNMMSQCKKLNVPYKLVKP